MLQLLRPLATLCLALLMAWQMMPTSLMHSVFHHEEENEAHAACCRSGVVHFEEPHEHCELLYAKAVLFVGAPEFPAVDVPVFRQYPAFQNKAEIWRAVAQASPTGRGPPLVTAPFCA